MVKNLNLAALLVVLALTACKKDVQREVDESLNALQQATASASTTSAKTLYLEVEVVNDAAYKIVPDGSGNYIHGKDRVQAVIWGDSGDFFMNTNTNASRDALRKIVFRRLPLSSDLLPVDRLNGVRNYRMRTQNVGSNIASMLPAMRRGDTKPLGFFIWGESPAGVFDWKLRFQYHQDYNVPSDVSNTDFVLVSKLRDASDPNAAGEKYPGRNVWQIEPLSEKDPSIPYKAHLKDGRSVEEITGYYSVPFRFILIERAR